MGHAVSTVCYTNSLLTQIRDVKDWGQLIGSSTLENLSKDACTIMNSGLYSSKIVMIQMLKYDGLQPIRAWFPTHH